MRALEIVVWDARPECDGLFDLIYDVKQSSFTPKPGGVLNVTRKTPSGELVFIPVHQIMAGNPPRRPG